MKKVCFALGHPAQYHLYKALINNLKEKGSEVHIYISEKDILKDLLDKSNLQYTIIPGTNSANRNKSRLFKLINSSISFYKLIKRLKPDIIIGCLSQIVYAGAILRIPTVFNAEDDINYTLLQGIITYPFVKHILTPYPTNTGLFNYKRIPYNGYHKLAYLHPKRFQPDRGKVEIPVGENYFILRFANLKAYHDINAKGISDEIAQKLIDILCTRGKILITSERQLPYEFEKYRFKGNILDIHHYLFFASLYIGDSQSMAVEAAILGTPNIRYNNFVSKISVLNELEDRYLLTKGIRSTEPERLFKEVKSIVNGPDNFCLFKERRNHLISEKIDTTDFFTWFIENYPESVNVMKKNPDYQKRFL